MTPLQELAQTFREAAEQYRRQGMDASRKKQRDECNGAYKALCAGCHQLVGILAGRKFVDENDGWENLIHLVMARRMAEKSKEFVGVYACVEIEHLTGAQVEEMAEDDAQVVEITARKQYGATESVRICAEEITA